MLNIAKPLSFSAKAPPLPEGPPPHKVRVLHQQHSDVSRADSFERSTTEPCESPLLYVLAGMSMSATPKITKIRTDSRTDDDFVDDDDDDDDDDYDYDDDVQAAEDGQEEEAPATSGRDRLTCTRPPPPLSGKVLLQTLLPNLKFNDDSGDSNVDVAIPGGEDESDVGALAELEKRIVAHVDASLTTLAQKLEDLLNQRTAEIIKTLLTASTAKETPQIIAHENYVEELSPVATPNRRFVRASPSPSLLGAFQTLYRDDDDDADDDESRID